jgi:antitoxin PrlF
MLHSTLTSKGQTTIPSEVREALNIRPGDKISYEVTADRVTLRAHPGTRSLKGALASRKGKGLSFSQIRTSARAAWAKALSSSKRRP